MITEVPDFTPQEAAPVEPAEMVTGIPEYLAPQATREALGNVALQDESVYQIPVSYEPTREPIPIDHPGPTAYNQAAANGSLPDHLTVINR